MNVVKCRSCPALVVWAAHRRTGKPAPLDAEPTNKGNCVLDGDGKYHVLGKLEERQAAVLNGVELRTNHFQTCDNPERFRR